MYRGISGRLLPAEFWTPNQFDVKGGVEAAFMSTTRNVAVAMAYAAAASRDGAPGVRIRDSSPRPLMYVFERAYIRIPLSQFVFEIQQGMIDRGEDVAWISQYEHEQEILFAPLAGVRQQRAR